jgi:hypothetical protein
MIILLHKKSVTGFTSVTIGLANTLLAVSSLILSSIIFFSAAFYKGNRAIGRTTIC